MRHNDDWDDENLDFTAGEMSMIALFIMLTVLGIYAAIF